MITTSAASPDYYVYVYIDPRNYEEFYYGKGKGSRKEAHLFDGADTDKTRRINAIKGEGLDPIVRVIARDLTEHDALLVEKTLLWKLGRQLTNISSGHHADKFRPQHSLHKTLSGFDYRCGIYYYNVGECAYRNWDDYRAYGFISGGQGPRWRDAICGFNEGDLVVAYLKSRGFVGIGRIIAEARPVREVMIDGRPLLSLDLDAGGMAENIDNDDLCEYVARVEWLASVDRQDAKWEAKAGLYTTQHVRASLDGQPGTIAYLEAAFGLKIAEVAQ